MIEGESVWNQHIVLKLSKYWWKIFLQYQRGYRIYYSTGQHKEQAGGKLSSRNNGAQHGHNAFLWGGWSLQFNKLASVIWSADDLWWGGCPSQQGSAETSKSTAFVSAISCENKERRWWGNLWNESTCTTWGNIFVCNRRETWTTPHSQSTYTKIMITSCPGNAVWDSKYSSSESSCLWLANWRGAPIHTRSWYV